MMKTTGSDLNPTCVAHIHKIVWDAKMATSKLEEIGKKRAWHFLTQFNCF